MLDGENVEPAPGGNDGVAPPPDNGGASEPDPVVELTTQLEALRTESAAQIEAVRTESNVQIEALRVTNNEQLNAFRELARTLPGIVPELVQGATVEAEQGSLETAREAFNQIAAGLPPAGQGPGAGGGARSDAGGGGSEVPPVGSKGFQLIYGAIASGKTGGLSR